jgi:hypothetical protein
MAPTNADHNARYVRIWTSPPHTDRLQGCLEIVDDDDDLRSSPSETKGCNHAVPFLYSTDFCFCALNGFQERNDCGLGCLTLIVAPVVVA